jgi:hypothetical protein
MAKDGTCHMVEHEESEGSDQDRDEDIADASASLGLCVQPQIPFRRLLLACPLKPYCEWIVPIWGSRCGASQTEETASKESQHHQDQERLSLP